MGIQMTGIDHGKASIDIRTEFSFTKKKTAEALEIIKKEKGICGCVLLSTCNRMELWISTEGTCEISLYELLSKVRKVPAEHYQKYFTERKEKDAVEHLFRLACGLESRILGEGQILTQVKEALSASREYHAADHVLEVLFRMAVTAGKKVRTEVTFSMEHASVIHQALATLCREGIEICGKKCMVIGNGEMGKLAATVLRQEGADVTVTVRQYHSGMVQIPQGCRRIDYGKRMSLIASCDLVVSATASPNYTVTQENLRNVELDHELLLVDLAVPRDIEPEVQKLRYVRLYDIDYFKVDVLSGKMKTAIAKAEEIQKDKMEEFDTWYTCRDMIPRIEKMKKEVATDLGLRLQKILYRLPIETEEKQEFEKQIGQAAQKVTNKILFELHRQISDAAFQECMEGLEKIYPDQEDPILISGEQ